MARILRLTRLVDGKPVTEDWSSESSVYLDRVFLLQSSETGFAPRRQNAPEIFACRGRWLLYNRSKTEKLSLTSPAGYVASVGPEMLRWLDDGVSILDAYDVSVSIMAKAESAEATGVVAGPPTRAVGWRRREALQMLVTSNDGYRGILTARFQAYFHPIQAPRPLTALETANCLGDVTEQDVNNAQSKIKYHTGLDLRDVGPLLLSSRIITIDDVQDLPHMDCRHTWL